jgi:hypothetical protein
VIFDIGVLLERALFYFPTLAFLTTAVRRVKAPGVMVWSKKPTADDSMPNPLVRRNCRRGKFLCRVIVLTPVLSLTTKQGSGTLKTALRD